MTIAITQTNWIPISEAQRRLAIGRRAMLKLLASGKLSIRDVPGSTPRVNGEEINAMALSYTKPASAAS